MTRESGTSQMKMTQASLLIQSNVIGCIYRLGAVT